MSRTRKMKRVSRTIVSKESKRCLCAVADDIRQALERTPCKGRSLDLDETRYLGFGGREQGE
jgi:hypothetical protein